MVGVCVCVLIINHLASQIHTSIALYLFLYYSSLSTSSPSFRPSRFLLSGNQTWEILIGIADQKSAVFFFFPLFLFLFFIFWSNPMHTVHLHNVLQRMDLSASKPVGKHAVCNNAKCGTCWWCTYRAVFRIYLSLLPFVAYLTLLNM